MCACKGIIPLRVELYQLDANLRAASIKDYCKILLVVYVLGTLNTKIATSELE